MYEKGRTLLQFITIFMIQISLIKTRFKKKQTKQLFKNQDGNKKRRKGFSVESRLSAAHLNKADGRPSLVLRQLSTSVFGAFFCKRF